MRITHKLATIWTRLRADLATKLKRTTRRKWPILEGDIRAVGSREWFARTILGANEIIGQRNIRRRLWMQRAVCHDGCHLLRRSVG
jgi:hypothetical protein